MMRLRSGRPLLAAALLAAGPLANAAPAGANITPIVADVAAPWTHAATGIAFPITLAGFAREGVEDYGSKQLDIAATYQDRATHTTATLYVFHAGLADASVWHDRILTAMAIGALGTPDTAHPLATSFTPAGQGLANQGTDSGLRTTMAMAGKNTAASGVAIFAHDDWLIAVRMSSGTLAPPALDARLAAFVAALPVPAAKVPAPAAYRIAACPTPMPAAAAARLPATIDPQTLAGLLVSVIDAAPDPAAAHQPPPPPLCRDAGGGPSFALYHGADPATGYTVALGDAGNAVTVAPDPVAKAHGGPARYTVTLATVDERLGYAGFTRLPTLAQVAAIVGHERPLIAYDRAVGGTKGTINILGPMSP